VLLWLKALPLAPKYHPIEAKSVDRIAYILKKKKEASHYGICKIIPMIYKAPKRFYLGQLESNNLTNSMHIGGINGLFGMSL